MLWHLRLVNDWSVDASTAAAFETLPDVQLRASDRPENSLGHDYLTRSRK
jgi:hypothetical protein